MNRTLTNNFTMFEIMLSTTALALVTCDYAKHDIFND